MSIADAISLARPQLAAMVDHEERRTGSRMAAYEAVAARTGRSPSWIRKIIGRQPGLGLAHDVALNIADAYGRLCSKVETAGAERASALEAKIATAEIDFGTDDRMVRAARAAAAAALAVLREDEKS